MDVTDEIIARFFRNEADSGEVAAVKAYFDQYPEQMEKYALEMEEFRSTGLLHPATSREIFKKIEEDLVRRQPARIRIYRRLAVAASVMIILGAGWWFVTGTKGHKADVRLAEERPSYTQVVNSSDTVMHIVLKDGSTVDLERQSGISYYEPFIHHSRDISLKGTAVFNVAKDQSSSFTVYAGGVATTALGTKFKVDASGKKDKVTVQLYEGKVVVKQVNGTAMNYLSPGQQLAFYGRSQSMTLTRMEAGDKTNMAPDKKQMARDQRDLLVFRDLPFETVIARLEKEFRINIKVEAADVGKINVTVEFKRTDPVFYMLNSIAALNGLTVTQQGNTYYIK